MRVDIFLDDKLIASQKVSVRNVNEPTLEADYVAEALQSAIEDGLLEDKRRAEVRCVLRKDAD